MTSSQSNPSLHSSEYEPPFVVLLKSFHSAIQQLTQQPTSIGSLFSVTSDPRRNKQEIPAREKEKMASSQILHHHSFSCRSWIETLSLGRGFSVQLGILRVGPDYQEKRKEKGRIASGIEEWDVGYLKRKKILFFPWSFFRLICTNCLFLRAFYPLGVDHLRVWSERWLPALILHWKKRLCTFDRVLCSDKGFSVKGYSVKLLLLLFPSIFRQNDISSAWPWRSPTIKCGIRTHVRTLRIGLGEIRLFGSLRGFGVIW